FPPGGVCNGAGPRPATIRLVRTRSSKKAVVTRGSSAPDARTHLPCSPTAGALSSPDRAEERTPVKTLVASRDGNRCRGRAVLVAVFSPSRIDRGRTEY